MFDDFLLACIRQHVQMRQGAVKDRVALCNDDPLNRWVTELIKRRGKNKATVALANKLARIAWVITTQGVSYDPQHRTEHIATTS